MPEDNVKIFWLTGSFFQRKDTISQIKLAVSKKTETEVFNCNEDISGDDLESRIFSMDLFDTSHKTKIYILKALPVFFTNKDKNNKKWTALFSSIPQNRLIIIDNVSATSYPTLFKAVKGIGSVFEFPVYLKRQETLAMVSDIMESKGKIIENYEAELIVESVGQEPRNGYNIDRFYMTLEKLHIYMDPRKKIVEREDIYACVPLRSEFIIWDLLRAMDKRDLPLCLSLFNKSLDQKEIPVRALEDLLYASVKKYQLLLFLKEEKIQKKSDNEIIQKVKSMNNLKGEGSSIQRNYSIELTKDNLPKPLYVDTVVRNALQGFYGQKPEVDLYTRAELFRILKCLDDCFLKVRSGGCDEVDCRMLAENIFMTISKTFDDEILVSLRRLAYDTII